MPTTLSLKQSLATRDRGRKGNDDEDDDEDKDKDDDDDNDEDEDENLLLTTLRTLVVTKFATTPAQAWNTKGK